MLESSPFVQLNLLQILYAALGEKVFVLGSIGLASRP